VFTETKNFGEKRSRRQKLSTNFKEDSSPVGYDVVSINKNVYTLYCP
jgi:hypothetical protein